MKMSIAIGGRPLVHPDGHVQSGEVIEFDIRTPGDYTLEFRVRPFFVRFNVEIDEDGRYRLALVNQFLPDLSDLGALLSPLERELLDGLAAIIARDILRTHPRGDAREATH